VVVGGGSVTETTRKSDGALDCPSVEEIGPAQFPGVPVFLPTWVALYGGLTGSAGRSIRLNSDDDAYRLFVARSAAMGWLHGDLPGLWGTHDAYLDTDLNDGRFAWFHVGFPQMGADRPLPLLPLMSCVGSVVSRFGRPDLTGIQVELPAQISVDAGASHRVRHIDLASAVGWFWVAPDVEMVPITVTLSADGLDRDTEALAIEAWIGELAQRVFRVLAVRDEAVQLYADGDPQGGAPLRPFVTFDAALSEWSFEALGLTLSLLSEACRHSAIDSSVVASVKRSDV